ncbi:MAG: hypothetical protein C4530_16900 [Desulfobacteraceae bacterium]|nr:MAG: hypothetical protein C4530_16900 [Desulfobacteraceae bacterium]
MDSITGWVKQPKPAGGLDHLGSQAPCINIYARLLPGITNVTDRARYYSFYPWILWAYDKEHSSIKWAEFVEVFRKADCLFTLIAARHANQTDQNDDNHGIAMIGRDTLVKAIRHLEVGQSMRLSTYATMENGNPNRYFKNKLGGLGQYYLGPFKDLSLMEGNSRTGVQCTRERAQPIAEAMDAGVDRKLFFETLSRDAITSETLDRLAAFCPCRLIEKSSEHSVLVDMFFDRHSLFGEEGEQRRRTLCLIMHLIDQICKKENEAIASFDHFVFRAAVYTGYLPGGHPWKVPEALEGTRAAWAVYQRNEILSVAGQAVFWVALRMIQDAESSFRNTSDFVKYFMDSKIVSECIGKRGRLNFSDAVRDVKSRIPELKAWGNPNHELALARQIYENCTKQPLEKTLSDALDSLILLAARDDVQERPYGPFIFPDGYFSYYPINLNSFRQYCAATWSGFSLEEFLAWMVCQWGIETHLRVALRKLRSSGLNTFKVHPSEKGLRVNEPPQPVFTAPRFRQGLRMLKDIGAVAAAEKNDEYRLTELGHRLLGETVGN